VLAIDEITADVMTAALKSGLVDPLGGLGAPSLAPAENFFAEKLDIVLTKDQLKRCVPFLSLFVLFLVRLLNSCSFIFE
jgi:hypothetical protein